MHIVRPSTAALMAGACLLAPLPLRAQSAMRTDDPSVRQPPVDSDAAPGEIVITAQKREQRLSDVGIAVSALGSTDIAAVGRQDITAIATKVPGLQINQYSPTITVFNIRGVSQNDFADSQEAPIAFYNDEVYVAQLGAISGQNFDLERVEVLRGPQGTLFGRNATGGLIQIISAKPTRALDGFLTLTGGSYGQFASEGAIGGAIGQDMRARFSFSTDQHRGYIKNALGRDPGGARFYAARFQVAADVAGGELTLKVQLLRNDHDSGAGLYTAGVSVLNADGVGRFIGPNDNPYGTCAGCNPLGYRPPSDPLRVEINRRPDFDRRYRTLTGRYVRDLGGVTLTSITDYQYLRKRYSEDTDLSPIDAFNYSTRQNARQVSQELRLSANGARLNWVFGGYGLSIRSRNGYVADFRGIDGPVSDYGGVLHTDSLAAFGQIEYKVTDRISAIGGLRYSKDWKKLDYLALDSSSTPFVFNPSVYPDLAKRRFGNYSGKIEIDYHLAPGNLIYASVNRGTKAGGFGTLSFQPIDPAAIPFDQEVLTNYEGGIKLTMLDRTTHLNLSGFHYRYHDYQVFKILGTSQYIVNNDARLTGFEMDADTRPVRGLTLAAFFTYLDSRIFDVSLPSGRLADRRMPQAPRYSLGGSARYEFALGRGRASLSTDWKWNSASYFTAFNAPVDREPAFAVGNVRATYTLPDGHWEAALFANNVADERYRIYDLDITSVVGITQNVYARPRWIGGSLTYRIR